MHDGFRLLLIEWKKLIEDFRSQLRKKERPSQIAAVKETAIHTDRSAIRWRSEVKPMPTARGTHAHKSFAMTDDSRRRAYVIFDWNLDRRGYREDQLGLHDTGAPVGAQFRS